jgi:small neutral amino acid transporter SnatA (MarC family)
MHKLRNDIALTPLAIPMLAGPISLLIAFYSEHQETSVIISVVAMVAVAIAIFINSCRSYLTTWRLQVCYFE